MSQITKELRPFTGLAHYSRICQNCECQLSLVRIIEPMLIRVVQGSKIIGYQNKNYQISAGQLLVVPAGTVLDITNQNSLNPIYLADCFTWSQEILKQYASLNKSQSVDPMHGIKVIPFSANIFNLSIDYTINLIQDLSSPQGLILHQFMQLLHCLEIENIHLSIRQDEPLTLKVERFILNSPMTKWQSQQIAKQFAMSESTLRRHLFEEGTNLSNILYEVRMSYGLMLLQTTRLNITQIAQEVGYDSGSRFAIYFRKRFGFSPKEIRG